MRLLELFSGTKSVSKVAKELGFDVISLDFKKADINCDILDWDYTIYINLVILMLFGLALHVQNIRLLNLPE